MKKYDYPLEKGVRQTRLSQKVHGIDGTLTIWWSAKGKDFECRGKFHMDPFPPHISVNYADHQWSAGIANTNSSCGDVLIDQFLVKSQDEIGEDGACYAEICVHRPRLACDSSDKVALWHHSRRCYIGEIPIFYDE